MVEDSLKEVSLVEDSLIEDRLVEDSLVEDSLVEDIWSFISLQRDSCKKRLHSNKDS